MNNLSRIIIVLLLLQATPGKGQVTINRKDLPGDTKGYGISSLCYSDGIMYMPAERRPGIFRFDQSFNLLSPYRFNSKDPFEIEGCTFFKGNMYLLSENKAALYRREADGRLVKILDNLPQAENNDGMEGLTTNGTDRFYLLLERKKTGNHWSGILYTYGLNADTTNSLLSLIDTAEIRLPSEEYRCPEILYEAGSKTLLVLISKINDYAVEQMPLSKNGFPEVSKRRKVLHTELTGAAKKYKMAGYDSNLEGMTMYNNALYLISDNCWFNAGKCSEDTETLLLEIKGMSQVLKTSLF